MELTKRKTGLFLVSFLVLVAPASANGFDLFVDSTLDYFIDTTENAPSSSGSTGGKLSVSSQQDWNQGRFNGTSADRKDNSGELGIGYPNGSNPVGSKLNEGLVGYWRMDRDVSGSGGTIDDYSGNSFDGTTQSGVATGAKGIFGSSSAEFGGGSYVKVPNNPSLVGMQDLSFGAWVNPATLGKDDVVMGGEKLYEIVLDDGSSRCNTGQNLWWAVDNGDGDFAVNCEDIALSTDEWTHLMLVSDYSEDEIRIYVNGSLEVTDAGTGTVEQNNNGIGIGSRGDEFGDFDGRIDEVRIYNRSLSGSEVEQLYFRGVNGQFDGDYIRDINSSSIQDWKKLEVDAQIPSQTSVRAELRAQDYSGNTLETESFVLEETKKNYTISLQDSRNAELVLNGTSDKATKTWTVDNLAVYSKDSGSEAGEVNWKKWG